jgi:hydroxyacylglutathione hydrolase
VEVIVRNLVLIGLDRVAGWWGPDAVTEWSAAGHPMATLPHIDPRDLSSRASPPLVLDVRTQSEWDAGHLPGAIHIPLTDLETRLDELPEDGEIVTQCQGGGRSAIAASLLKAHGHTAVSNLEGGYAGWLRAGLPVDRAD